MIDLLRVVAVAMVLCRHYGDYPAKALYQIGWAGVDLFFVLSGFLVSGLLFNEYKKTGKVRFGRFLIRRGFKIYPAHYLMMAATLIIFPLISRFVTPIPTGGYGPAPLIGEFFYFQNYLGGYWNHTWSLAVEEHFYLLLVLLLYLSIGRQRIEKPGWIVGWFAAISISLLIGRLVSLFYFQYGNVAGATHLRIDSLFFGVFIAHFHHFSPETMKRFFFRIERWMLPIIVVLLFPLFIWPPTEWIAPTFGFTVFYLGFGALLVYVLYSKTAGNLSQNQVVAWVAGLGTYSYSIYLWHMFVRRFVSLLEKKGIPGFSGTAGFFVYIGICFIVGIVMAKLVELPALKIRDKYFPSAASVGKPQVQNQ